VNNLGAHLRAGDPLEVEPEMPATRVDMMRRALLDVTDSPAMRTSKAAMAITAAAGVALVSVWLLGWPSASRPTTARPLPSASILANHGTSRRQLLFITPKGTRVIWILHSD
jgi:hypothetical protein